MEPEKKEVSNILNERHIKILDILNGYKETDVKFLSEKLYTIPKTIRYDIKNLNYYLKKYKLPTIEDNKYLVRFDLTRIKYYYKFYNKQ